LPRFNGVLQVDGYAGFRRLAIDRTDGSSVLGLQLGDRVAPSAVARAIGGNLLVHQGEYAAGANLLRTGIVLSNNAMQRM
jgi:hypothetical protein